MLWGGGVDTVCAAAGLSKGRYHNVKTAACAAAAGCYALSDEAPCIPIAGASGMF